MTEWVSPRCAGCPECRPPHDAPGDCVCRACSPWGVPQGFSQNYQPHFCGTTDQAAWRPQKAGVLA